MDWSTYAQPEWNGSGDIPAAIRSLERAGSEGDAEKAYDRVLAALGNNHAGTYYPVALTAIPFLQELVSDGELWARVGALEVLIDLVGSFEPEPGFDTVEGSDGSTTPLALALRAKMGTMSSVLEDVLAAATHERERTLAAKLATLVRT